MNGKDIVGMPEANQNGAYSGDEHIAKAVAERGTQWTCPEKPSIHGSMDSMVTCLAMDKAQCTKPYHYDEVQKRSRIGSVHSAVVKPVRCPMTGKIDVMATLEKARALRNISGGVQ